MECGCGPLRVALWNEGMGFVIRGPGARYRALLGHGYSVETNTIFLTQFQSLEAL